MTDRVALTSALAALLAAAGCSDPHGGPMPPPDAGDDGGGDAGVDAASPDAGPPLAPPEWAPCDPTELPPGYTIPDGLECATLEVPVDRSRPDGDTVRLRVAIDRAAGPALPVFQLAGGPGGSSVAQAGIIPRLLPVLRGAYDLVYVDQRGTGDSGYMDCPGGYPESGDEWERCALSLADRDLDHFLTVDAADDLDDVRRWLGYDGILIRGGSYGTRLALEYARRHGEHVIAMVLDGAVPPDADFFSETTGAFDRGMAMLYADCAADVACSEMAPDLEGDIDGLIASATATPRRVTVGGTAYTEDGDLFRMLLQGLVVDAWFRFSIPRAAHEATLGDWTAWDGLMTELIGTPYRHAETGDAALRSQDSYVAPGLYLTVVCAEDLPNSPDVETLRELGRSQKYGDDHMADLAAACRSVPVTPLGADLRSPVESDVPTLVMSGAIDINTPAAWGDRLMETLSNARHVVVPDSTHATMTTPCGAHIIESFLLSAGDLDGLDTSCIDTVDVPFD